MILKYYQDTNHNTCYNTYTTKMLFISNTHITNFKAIMKYH